MKISLLMFCLCGALCANAQVKSDSTKVASAQASSPSTVSSKSKTDTIGCWFKELKKTRYSYGWFRTVKDSSLREVWQHGYMVKGQAVVYLYADRRTPVRNKVVDAFEHKPAQVDVK